MNPEGHLALDVTLFMLTVAAICVNLFYIPSWFRVSMMLGVLRLFRATGWLILGSRFGFVLFTTGDILITPPSVIALMFLAIGEILVIFFRGKCIQL